MRLIRYYLRVGTSKNTHPAGHTLTSTARELNPINSCIKELYKSSRNEEHNISQNCDEWGKSKDLYVGIYFCRSGHGFKYHAHVFFFNFPTFRLLVFDF